MGKVRRMRRTSRRLARERSKFNVCLLIMFCVHLYDSQLLSLFKPSAEGP